MIRQVVWEQSREHASLTKKMKEEKVMLQVGDLVEVTKPFYWYRDERYEIGERFTFEEQHIGHEFEVWVKKV